VLGKKKGEGDFVIVLRGRNDYEVFVMDDSCCIDILYVFPLALALAHAHVVYGSMTVGYGGGVRCLAV